MSTTASDDRRDIERVLVITAHPDDVDFGSAGTIASWTARGVEVAYCVCTSGDAGGFDDTPRESMPQIRQREQRAAAEAVGVHNVEFLDYQDGRVTPSLELRRDLTARIRKFRPDVVLTHSPEINWEHIQVSHPDHRAVGEAAIAAVYPDARNEYAHPELAQRQLAPWTVSEVWLSEAPAERLNHAVDITDWFPAKVNALRAHTSQTGHINDLEGMLGGFLGENARRHNMHSGQLAEAFQIVHTA